ncbi:MAG TPA: hypothetical protein PK360_04490, partial [bacterium]|nr:hypothetical protein [bacterium]
ASGCGRWGNREDKARKALDPRLRGDDALKRLLGKDQREGLIFYPKDQIKQRQFIPGGDQCE